MLNLNDEAPCIILQGAGVLEHFPVNNLSGSGVIVTTPGLLRRGQLDSLLQKINIHYLNFEIIFAESNPSLIGVEEARLRLSTVKPNWCIAVGGGSALDTAKVLSAMLSEENLGLKLLDTLVGNAKHHSSRISLYCIPTTSGTGAEITPFATVWDKKQSKKYSFSGEELSPDLVVLDPVLTLTAPQDVTLYCALDTCSHALESLWNKRANAQSSRFANESLQRLVMALPRLLGHPEDIQARESMQIASFWAGMAIRHTRTAIAHSISYPLTLHFGVPHGLACSFLLPRIAELVTTQNAWFPNAALATIEEVIQLLESLKLEDRIGQYCSKEQLISYKHEMLTPGRSDNFVLDSHFLDKILQI